jgi:hypothetical protein
MQGNTYIRHSDLFDEQVVPLPRLKKQLRRFNLSNALFHVSRMNVLLGFQRMLREGREAMQKLQGHLVNNYIDDEILEGKLKPLFGPSKRDECSVFTRQQSLALLRLIAQECKDSETMMADGQTPGGYLLGRCCLAMNDHLLSKREERDISEGTDLKRRKHLAIQLAPLLELYNPPRLDRSVVRAEVIFSELLNSERMKAIAQRELRGFDLAKAFLEATGLSIDQYKELCLGIISWIYGHSAEEMIADANLFTFQRAQFIGESKIDAKDFDRYLSLDSIKVSAIKSHFKNRQVKLLPHFDYVLFRSRPLIELDTDNFICADSCFAVEKLSSGIYWTIIDSLKGADKQSAFDAFGYLFELYVNRLFAKTASGEIVFISSPKYANGESSFDGIILTGSQLLVLEYKASFMRIDAKYNGKIRNFENELDKKFGIDKTKRTEKGVAQLAKHIERLFHRHPDARYHIAELDKLLCDSYTKIEKVTPVLVVQEPFLRFHIIEELLSKRFRRILKKREISNGVKVAPLAVLDIDTLEELAPNLVAGDFTLAQCLNARAYRDPDYKQFWPEFISDHFEQIGKREDRDVSEKFGEIMNRAKRNFFGD